MNKKVKKSAPCPCGAGKTYGECCWGKGFVWLVDEKGEYSKSIPIRDEVRRVLEKQRERFKRLFGRAPGKGDRVFLDTYKFSTEDLEDSTEEAMEKVGLDPAYIYASRKTGLIITTDNQNLFSTAELREWDDALEEFDRLKGKANDSPEQRRRNRAEDRLMLDFLEMQLVYAVAVDGFATSRTQENPLGVADAYAIFCATRTCKSLRAIETLLNRNLGEDALNLVRSSYENYLNQVFALVQRRKLEELVLARNGLTTGKYRYGVAKSGKLDRRVIIEVATGRKIENDITTATLASWSPFEEDSAIHSSLYPFLSRYTHPHILAIHHYFDQTGFSATRREVCFEAIFFGTFVAALGLDALSALPSLPEQLRMDLRFFLKRPRSSILTILKLSPKEDSPDRLFEHIESRTKVLGKPWQFQRRGRLLITTT